MTKVTPRGAEVSEERAALVHQQRTLRTRLAATAPEIEWTPPPSLALPEAVLRIHRARLDQLRQVVPHSPRSSALSGARRPRHHTVALSAQTSPAEPAANSSNTRTMEPRVVLPLDRHHSAAAEAPPHMSHPMSLLPPLPPPVAAVEGPAATHQKLLRTIKRLREEEEPGPTVPASALRTTEPVLEDGRHSPTPEPPPQALHVQPLPDSVAGSGNAAIRDPLLYDKLLAVLKLAAGSGNQAEAGSRAPLPQPVPVRDVPRKVLNWDFTAIASESKPASVPFGSGGAPPFPTRNKQTDSLVPQNAPFFLANSRLDAWTFPS